jgi:hypothetical protein
MLKNGSQDDKSAILGDLGNFAKSCSSSFMYPTLR